MALSADDIRRIFKEELSIAMARIEHRQDAVDTKISEVDRRVAGLEQAGARASSEPPRKAPRVAGGRSLSQPPSPPSFAFSSDTIEVNGWPSTTQRDNIKDHLDRILKDVGLADKCTILVLRKYGDRALLRFSEHSTGMQLLERWKSHAPKYTNLAGNETLLYARWRPTRERALDEWLLRKAYQIMREFGIANIEKEKAPLVIYMGAKLVVRVQRGQLIATNDWPSNHKFGDLVAAVDKDRL